MPRKTPVPVSEKEIGERLRSVRASLFLTGTAFALKHGISSGNLAKYENGWVPLPWAAGDPICAREGISQRWLATGKGPRAPYFDFDRGTRSAIPRRISFSQAYHGFLEPRLEALEREYRKGFKPKSKGVTFSDPGFLGWFDGDNARRSVLLPLHQYMVESWFNALPESKRFDLLRSLEKCLLEFLEEEKISLGIIDIQKELSQTIMAFFEHQRLREETTQPPNQS